MSNLFYYFGFLYIIYSIRSLWSFKITMYGTELINTEEILQTNYNKYKPILKKILAIIFFIWAILGYDFDTPEKYFFLLNIIVIISYWSFTYYFIIKEIIIDIFKSNVIIDNEESIKANLALCRIRRILELIIVSSILCHHFLF